MALKDEEAPALSKEDEDEGDKERHKQGGGGLLSPSNPADASFPIRIFSFPPHPPNPELLKRLCHPATATQTSSSPASSSPTKF